MSKINLVDYNIEEVSEVEKSKKKCVGKKKNGEQCGFNATVGKFCKKHSDSESGSESDSESKVEKSKKCFGKKKSGEQCGFNATVGEFCKRHSKENDNGSWSEWGEVESDCEEDPNCEYEYDIVWVEC